MGLPNIIAVQQDDGSWAAYDDNKFEGDASALTVGRGDTREEALNDFVDACEWTDAGNGMIKQIVFALADQSLRRSVTDDDIARGLRAFDRAEYFTRSGMVRAILEAVLAPVLKEPRGTLWQCTRCGKTASEAAEAKCLRGPCPMAEQDEIHR